MNIWQNAVITNKGLALQSKLIEGHRLHITRAVTGAGWVNPTLLQQQTAVSDPKQNLSFHPVSYPEQGKCAVPVTLDNVGLETGYTAHQISFFAMDPDEGEILYAIAGSTTNEEKDGTIVPAEHESPGYGAEWTFYFQYGNADGVTVIVDAANSVTWGDMKAYVAETVMSITYPEIDSVFPWPGGSHEGEGADGVAVQPIHSAEIDSIVDSIQ